MRDELRYGPNTALVEEFLTELKTAKYWLKPDGEPLPEWRLFTAGTLGAARDAAWSAARGDAARDAAWDAAGNAAWSAARAAAGGAARDAAWVAAWVAARDAAWDAARVAAGNAARDAARGDAGLFARLLVVNDLRDKVAWEHFDHANKRMRVWRKGYCLLCDVNGTLYVYARKERADDNTGIKNTKHNVNKYPELKDTCFKKEE